ncbi:hypothetical protein N825_12385 [Skermanella stibiiresistens SB22]|uniref:Bacterial transcriptional activator domain-containing protein n=1 Tax=Skermanella stibiiresistens SB22 TaxID=1385369 RepID=W9H1K4_9PROT|nr:BTAD domain-containing putative transcriptional regulator [Skermanella stibiiresistens]EWY38602.1 hypothetical protein N825_12385 [Skermanella stibiiresistens SB22]
MDQPTLRLIGDFAITGMDGRMVAPPGRKARMALAWIALNGPRPVPRERLAGVFWDDRPDRHARHSLRQCLLELRQLGGAAGIGLIDAGKDTVTFALPAERVDALAIERLARDGTLASLRAAASLCVGELLPGMDGDCGDFGAWLAAERARFSRISAGVFARLTELCEALEDWDGVASAAEGWLNLDPACEDAHRALMRVHAQAGRRSDAVRQYQACAEAVRRRLDAEPEERTVDLLRDIRGGGTIIKMADPREPEPRRVSAKPSLAVLPFDTLGDTLGGTVDGGGVADGLSHDILARLARLRSLFVIARGSSFRFRGGQIDPRTVGRTLGARYLVTGSVRAHAGRLRLTVELVETETATVVWGDVFDTRLGELFAVQEDLTGRIVAALEIEIEAAEIRHALAWPVTSLDAWGAYHRGLWHMFRFTRDDNETARGFFQQALRLDPICARAHAGLSFTHFQDAFLHRTGDRRRETDRAYRFAERGVALDERDPTSHWALGRALWLLDRHDDAVGELEQAVQLNPNFALGHYTIAFVQAQGGDAHEALGAVDLAQRLSPIDPLLFGMLGVRALARLDLGDYSEAADWGDRAARRPNAHVHIHAIAAFCDALADRHDQAVEHARRIKETAPTYRCGDFLMAFHTLRPRVADLIRREGPAIGIPV